MEASKTPGGAVGRPSRGPVLRRAGLRTLLLGLVALGLGFAEGAGPAYARGGAKAPEAPAFQVPRGSTVRLAAPRASDLRPGALAAFFEGRATRMLSARLERTRDGRSLLVLTAARNATPSAAYAVRGTLVKGGARTIPVEVVARAKAPDEGPPPVESLPGVAFETLQTADLVRGRTEVLEVPAGAQGASEVRVVAAGCSLAVAVAGVLPAAPGFTAELRPEVIVGRGGASGPLLTKLHITVAATAPLGGGRRLMALRNGTWSLLPLCFNVLEPPTATAPPPSGGGSTPAAPTVFSRMPVDTTDHRWVTSYLLSLASLYVYPGETENWSAFRLRFQGQFAAWGMDSSIPQDYVRNAASGTQCAILHDAERIIVVFRGSQTSAQPESASELGFAEGGRDWSADLNAPFTAPGSSWGAGVGVHTGFHLALDAVYSTVRARVAALKQGTQRRVFLTGHSLGGALAMLCAYRLAHINGVAVQGVYTYGQPRVGNAAFAQAYAISGLHARTFRWAHDGDIATKLPLALSMGYRHAGIVNAVRLNLTCARRVSESLLPGGITPHSMPGYCQNLRACMPSALRSGMPPAP